MADTKNSEKNKDEKSDSKEAEKKGEHKTEQDLVSRLGLLEYIVNQKLCVNCLITGCYYFPRGLVHFNYSNFACHCRKRQAPKAIKT